MAQVCKICGRGTTVGQNVSHSKRRTKKTQKINLQLKRVDGTKTKICTSCIKSLNKKTASK
ncbi:MAG TPA: 50S ribosomal protein L28 [Patescibacteria group bacterium]|nr:50S ribosomal protein L28 [Patescibacteria group bacterium]